MSKPTYEDLEQRVQELEDEVRDLKLLAHALGGTGGDIYSFLDELRDGFFVTDIKGTVTHVNKALSEMFGYERPVDAVGNHFSEYLPKEVTEEVGEKFNRAINDINYEELIEIPAYRKDGSTVFVQLKHSPVMEGEKIVGIKGMIRDITPRKMTEDALRESEERYRSLFEDNQMVVFLVEPDTGKIVEANSAACSFYGYSKEQLTHLKITDINTLPDEDLRKLADDIMSKTQGRFFFTHRLANGEIRNIESFVGPIVVNGRHLLYSMVHDITERMQAEKAFWESQERYRLLIESMNDGFAILDENDLFSFVNDRFLDMVGCSEDEVIGDRTIRLLDEKNQKIANKHLKARRKGERGFYELSWAKKDGGKVPTIISATPIRDERGLYKGSFAVITDITELKKTEQDLIESRNELKDKTRNLEEVNAALRVLLEQREKDKTEIEEQVLFNIQELIVPYLEELKRSGLNKIQNAQVDILESNLNDIISPFARSLSAKFLNLTPTEVQVANLIRQGRTTKVIADSLHLSSKTIEEHRKNIRKKLGIKNRKTNLRSYLLDIQ
jgi:PAS domain S-box-containing protein